jgi:RNA polymerase sigma-70 factor (ECF subfamily)
MASLTDISLVAQVAVFGNKRAFDELVRRYQSPVRRFFLHQTLGDSQLSDDLAQDTFIKAYMNISKFRGLSSFQTWLMRIAYNVFYDHHRKKNVECGMLNEEWSAIPMKDDQLRIHHSTSQQSEKNSSIVTQHSSLKMDLYAALALLKPDERTCITLQLIDGYDIAGITKITGLKEGTVKSHLSRGKEKLANYLRKNGYDGR